MRCFADISAINRENKAWYSSIIVCITFAQYCNGPYMSLQNSLTEVFSNFLLNCNCCLIAIGINAVAVIKNSEQSFNIFDAHCSDLHGIPHSLFMHTVLLLTICTIVNRDNKWEFQIWFFFGPSYGKVFISGEIFSIHNFPLFKIFRQLLLPLSSIKFSM